MEIKKEYLCWATLRMMRRIKDDLKLDESIISDPLDRVVIGYAKESPYQDRDLASQIKLAWAWWKSGETLEKDWCRSLEERAVGQDV